MDLTIVNWIATHLRCPPLDFLMPVITMLGEYGFIWIAVCIFLLARKQTRRMGCACGNAAGAGACLIASSQSALDDAERLAKRAQVLDLTESAFFSDRFIEQMLFPLF